jgi:hypothetical protein
MRADETEFASACVNCHYFPSTENASSTLPGVVP